MDHPLLMRADMDFLLHDWLKVSDALGGDSAHSRETIDALLDLSERLAQDAFLPHYKASDQHEPTIAADGVAILPAAIAALRQYADLGLFSAGFSEDLGGLGFPFVVTCASYAWFAAANIATAAYPMLTIANARLLCTFGSDVQIDTFARPQIAGRWFGTMCLSEPQAGSNLASVRARAAFVEEDDLGRRYALRGNKMWISGGEQDASENIVHLVLAKVPADDGTLPTGTKGLSLFIVPRRLRDGSKNDVTVAGLNHKMGYRGTANCLLNFGENAGATGWLVGQEGDGLRQMFVMMNEARINVGLGAASLAYRGFRQSVSYASERRQGRIGAATGDVAIVEHPDVRRMLLLQKCYAEGALALCLYTGRLVDEGDDSAELLALLTPIAKSWPSEFGVIANDLAIQVHGGYGYTRDFDVEQLYRDNRLNPIHEGTTGIQAIDLLERKLLRDARGYKAMRARIERTMAAARDQASLSSLATELATIWDHIDQALALLSHQAEAQRLQVSTPFLSAFGHAVVAWLWLDQAVSATVMCTMQGSQQIRSGKIMACEYFYFNECPKIYSWLQPILCNQYCNIERDFL